MLIMLGRRFAGKVDHVGGLFLVKTLFAHGYWLPTMPKASYLFWDDPQDPFRGVQIPLCWRSVFKGWFWAYPILLLLLSSLLLVDTEPPAPHNLAMRRLIGLPVLALVIGFPIWLWRKLARITPERARDLAQRLEIPEFVLQEHIRGNRDAVRHWLETQPLDAPVRHAAPRVTTTGNSATTIREGPSSSQSFQK